MLSEPYIDDENNCSILIMTQEKINELVDIAYSNILQIAVDGTGDKVTNISKKRWRHFMKTLITNAKIYSMDKVNSNYGSMIIENDRIVELGEYRDLKNNITKEDIIWDFKGMALIPGMTDSHIHFLDYSLSLNEVSLRGVKSLEVCGELVREKAKQLQPGEWITGGGWDKNLWDGEFPNKEILDRVAPNNPVYLIGKDCHTSWVNSIALEKSGIDGNTFIDGGEIKRLDGIPTGILKENAQSLVKNIIPYPNEEIIIKALEKGIKTAHSFGLTAVHNMSLQNDRSFYLFFKCLKKIKKEKFLTLRFTLNPILEVVEEIVRIGMEKELMDDFLKLGASKLFTDGSLGSQSAWLIDDYLCIPHCKGMPVEYGQKLEDSIKRSISLGYPVAVHAIGDRANREVLNILDGLHNITRDLRHRIEHAQFLNRNDIGRFAKLGVIASVQPIHLLADIDLIEKYWGERGRWAYPFNSLIEKGTIMAFGSDAPVEDLNPFIGIYAAVNRQRKMANVPFYNKEKITVYNALKAYTWGPAYAVGEESIRGTLEKGKKADFVVLDKDIFNISPKEILDIKVEYTVVDGEKVYASVKRHTIPHSSN